MLEKTQSIKLWLKKKIKWKACIKFNQLGNYLVAARLNYQLSVSHWLQQ